MQRIVAAIEACALGIAAAVVLMAAASASADRQPDPYLRPIEVPAPADNQITPARVELGKALFFDPRLSASNWISCASCHNPALGWSDALKTGFGHNMKSLARNTPTILNAAFQSIFMWDGRKATLEDQALGPIQADVEMNQDIAELVKKLESIAGYRAMFERAYPGEAIADKTIGRAIANFERTIVSTEAPFDRWRKGDQGAMNDSAKRGFALFEGKANCVACHMGFNFTDNGFHNIGLMSQDEGRFAHRKVPSLKGAFKTPTLRDIELTGPYMHNGMYKSLDEVVDHYDRGGDRKEHLSVNINPLGLNDQERRDLVAFLKSLTGTPMTISLPMLPQ
ncbi:MAG: cytochrome-c peroxidase [Burkholderiales bacterium]